MVNVPWHIESVNLAVTKHFALKYMRLWSWDFHDLRDALRQAYNVEKVGKEKYELFVQKSGFKKIVTVYYIEEEKLICITGSSGGGIL